MPSAEAPDVPRALASVNTEETVISTNRAILYALGVGAKRNELDLVYEGAPDFKVLPTMGVIPAFDVMWQNKWKDAVPPFDPMALLHGEQFLALHRPIPTDTPLVSECKPLALLDKGKALCAIFSVTTSLKSGEPVCTNEFTLFIRGAGGWGGQRNLEREGAASWANEVPAREPDKVVQEKTTEEQAALYRLSGDLNPLHVDPSESKKGGFDVPILHGLCTFGIAGKHIFRDYCGSDPAKFKSIKVRFAAPVFPGETLETRMWKEPGKVVFTVRVVERDTIVIASAAVEVAE
ncbi:HotDog domain-containing protein [Hyaloraphidium curvatum]|nr:HotDog domain-containing protein [Hyaloraphidium curvatum]